MKNEYDLLFDIFNNDDEAGFCESLSQTIEKEMFNAALEGEVYHNTSRDECDEFYKIEVDRNKYGYYDALSRAINKTKINKNYETEYEISDNQEFHYTANTNNNENKKGE